MNGLTGPTHFVEPGAILKEHRADYERRVARAYEASKALNNAAGFGVDDAIDPADTRAWLASLLASIRPPPPREGKKRPAIDAW